MRTLNSFLFGAGAHLALIANVEPLERAGPSARRSGAIGGATAGVYSTAAADSGQTDNIRTDSGAATDSTPGAAATSSGV